MNTRFWLCATMGLIFIGCSEKADKTAQTTNAPTSGRSPLNAPADYLGAMGKAQQNAVKTVDTTRLNQAVQLFNVEHGRNPKDLNELVEQKYLPRLPDAPYGMKLQYDAESGKVQVIKQ